MTEERTIEDVELVVEEARRHWHPMEEEEEE